MFAAVRFVRDHAGPDLDTSARLVAYALASFTDTAGRADKLYGVVDSLSVAHDVRAWCLKNGSNAKYRIVLAGFDGEHGSALTDAGWSEVEWFTAGFLTGGMGNTGTGNGGHQQARERLWLSPHCLRATPAAGWTLFDDDGCSA